MDEVNSQASVCINNKHSLASAKKFAAMLKRRKASIICAGEYSSAQLEMRITKVLKRIVYGYRDFQYFSLEIKGVLSRKLFSLGYDEMYSSSAYGIAYHSHVILGELK